MRARIWPIARIALGIGLMGVTSFVFLDQGRVLIRQGSLAGEQGGLGVVFAGPLAGNSNDNSDGCDNDNSNSLGGGGFASVLAGSCPTDRSTTSAPAPTRTRTTTATGTGQQVAPPVAPPPPPPGGPGNCQFVRGFADFHRTLNGRDGNCLSNEFADPNGTGDTLQLTSLPSPNGLMVWRKATNSMAWTDGSETWGYSKCLLQVRKNNEVWAWELNPNLLIPESAPVPPGACDTLPRLADDSGQRIVGSGQTSAEYLPSPG